jgi:hypothetical protein
MLRRVFYIVLSVYLFATLYYLMMLSYLPSGDREHSKVDGSYAGLSRLTSEEPVNHQLTKPTPSVVQSHTATVHAGATLIKPTSRANAVNTAAVNDGATLFKRPPINLVQSNTAAVHDGATLIKWPPAKIVQSNTAAVHIGETLIKPPSPSSDSVKPKPSSKTAQSKFAPAVPEAPTPIRKRKIAPSDRDWFWGHGEFIPYVSQD